MKIQFPILRLVETPTGEDLRGLCPHRPLFGIYNRPCVLSKALHEY